MILFVLVPILGLFVLITVIRLVMFVLTHPAVSVMMLLLIVLRLAMVAAVIYGAIAWWAYFSGRWTTMWLTQPFELWMGVLCTAVVIVGAVVFNRLERLNR